VKGIIRLEGIEQNDEVAMAWPNEPLQDRADGGVPLAARRLCGKCRR